MRFAHGKNTPKKNNNNNNNNNNINYIYIVRIKIKILATELAKLKQDFLMAPPKIFSELRYCALAPYF